MHFQLDLLFLVCECDSLNSLLFKIFQIMSTLHTTFKCLNITLFLRLLQNGRDRLLVKIET